MMFQTKNTHFLGITFLANVLLIQAQNTFVPGEGIQAVQAKDGLFMVKINNTDVPIPCSGVLVTPNTVITSATCFGNSPSSINYNNTQIIIGASKNDYKIASLIVNPNWTAQNRNINNLAIVKLNKCVDSKFGVPGAIDYNQIGLDENMYQVTSAFSTSSKFVDGPLSQIQTIIGDEKRCNFLHNNSTRNGDIICTKISPRSNICFGDRGSPLLSQSSKQIVGISSYFFKPKGQICDANNSVGVFTNLKNYEEFLISNGITCTGAECDSKECPSVPKVAANRQTRIKNKGLNQKKTTGFQTFNKNLRSKKASSAGNRSLKSQCTSSLISSSVLFVSSGTHKDFDSSSEYGIGCNKNSFHLNVQAQSRDDFYVRLYPENGYYNNDFVEIQIGFKSGRNNISNNIGLQKRSILSTGKGESEIDIFYEQGSLKVKVDNSEIQDTIANTPIFKSLRFATFTENAFVYNATVKCINDNGC
ncbi:hypothetical protein BB561_000624 [Smittium simulii]|uniref:Peptidase S1 domain-containing protein n=1 Tax=Smittium simulii TaxID=133385 RepID=A0A2T9YYD2_9FUNG|nr:hypothetical protein BB561_000624 [Smittium simulii]